MHTWMKASQNHSTKALRDFFHILLSGQRLTTCLLAPPCIEHEKQRYLRQTVTRQSRYVASQLQLLVLKIFFDGSSCFTIENWLSNWLVANSPTPTYTKCGSKTTVVEHMKKVANATRALQISTLTSSSSTTTFKIVSGVFSDCMYRSMILHFVGAKRTPKVHPKIPSPVLLLKDENNEVCVFRMNTVLKTFLKFAPLSSRSRS
ncbi:hypothetical protein CSKR_107071 [Clonorchis sinensis]|uniref:Uncharacterized protein n=1 Tax=Clonorchis sinensis TaxID=79923 RepID=A0A419PDM8_CLOSI|nr:hypothetical protein CSKR_107071 [Clonorchis sinensis]